MPGSSGGTQGRKLSSSPTAQGKEQFSPPSFWAVYGDPMIKNMQKLGVGAHVADIFMGVVYYAGDVVLIAPSHQAMEQMLQVVEKFAADSNVQFSTDSNPAQSKSKCILVVGRMPGMVKAVPLKLCERDLPWVASWSYSSRDWDHGAGYQG